MNTKVEILPAILPKSFKDLQEHLDLLQGCAPRVQVDVVDGHFAKGKTWPYRDSATFTQLVKDEHGLPFWDSVDYQFDLMIERPEERVLDYVEVGGTQIVLHAKSLNAEKALQMLIDRRDQIGTFTVQVGVAIGVHAPLDALLPFESQFDFVQVMGIEHEGKQGEPFDKHARFLVERIRARYPHLPLQVDGGVSLESVPELVAAGANRLIAGSAIFKAFDPVAAYKDLVELANRQ